MQRDYSQLLQLLAVVWLSLGLVALLVWVAARISGIVLVFVLGVLLAVALSPAVQAARRLVGDRIPRALVVLGVYLLTFVGFFGLLAFLASPLIHQTQQLVEGLPQLLRDAPSSLPALDRAVASLGIEQSTTDLLGGLTDQVQGLGTAVFNGLLASLVGLTSAVGTFVLALVVSVYFLLDSQSLKERFLGIIPDGHAEDVVSLLDRLGTILGSFIRGQLIMALSIGIPVGLVCWALGLPYSALLGLFAGLAEFIPVIGSFIGAVPALLVALFAVSPAIALVLLVFFVVLNQVESNILAPKVVGEQLGLAPVTTIFALAVGFEIAGIWGAVFAAPAAAILWAVGYHAVLAWRRIFGEDPGRAQAEPDVQT